VLGFFKRIDGNSDNGKAAKKLLIESIKNITGLKPSNSEPYIMALSHVSAASTNIGGTKDSYERLEYLGDAVLGMVVAEHLFKKYPFKDEGFLTDLRSKMVNRESLNQVAIKLGLGKLLQLNGSLKNGKRSHSVYGDCLEALIGAVYLDKGYKAAQKFILKKILEPHFDAEELANCIINYKSLLIEWAQKENKNASFKILDVNQTRHYNEFTAQVIVDEQPLSTGFGYSKKKAEQDAAKKTCELLNLI
jgi:ribonuclease-3